MTKDLWRWQQRHLVTLHLSSTDHSCYYHYSSRLCYDVYLSVAVVAKDQPVFQSTQTDHYVVDYSMPNYLLLLLLPHDDHHPMDHH